MKNNRKFLLLGLFWLIIIIVFIGSEEFTLRTGREVLLKTQPVDPRDLFRGDYVVLNYEISSLDLSMFSGRADEFMPGDRVYVALDPNNKCASPIGIYKAEPKTGIFVKGTVRSMSGNNLSVKYGIENYFVPEGKGREIEGSRGDNLVIRASVDRFGTAAIKDLLINGNGCR